ncbi:hypothetical protein P7C70_g2299, partial [Phenoliferia sp. Uapishka_3]
MLAAGPPATRSLLLNSRLNSSTLRMAHTYAASKLKDSSLLKYSSYINGEWVSSSNTFSVTDPATGKSIGDVSDHGVEETKAAIEAASEAFKTWKKTTTKHRHDILLKLYKLMQDNIDDLGAIITLENGKPLTEGKGEIMYSSSFLEWFAEEAVRDYGDVIAAPTAGVRNIVIKQPVGVVGLVTPWNFPSAMITRKVAPALAAGCTVVVKAPPETPFSTLAFVELAERAGVPKGVINVVCTASNTKEVGLELTTNPAVRKISFTGSTPVGQLLMKQASSTIKKCSFELGGLAPFIVFGDADVTAAVDGAIAAKFRNTGQTCVCTQFLLIHSSIYDTFAEQLVKKVAAFKIGNGFDAGVTHGPLIHNAGVDKVDRHVKDAVKNGAKVLIGGKKAVVEGNEGGAWYEPTVLSDMAPCLISSEETFGPIAALYKFETEEEAIAMANAAEVGLAGYFYSQNLSQIWRVAEALEVGMVGVNTGLVSSVVIPFGGVKQSGLGREGSKYGLQECQYPSMSCHQQLLWGRQLDREMIFIAGGCYLPGSALPPKGNGTMVSMGGNPGLPQYDSLNGIQERGRILLLVKARQVRKVPQHSRLKWRKTERAPTDNPTFEWFPPKGDGLQIYMAFLHDALRTNLFPITFLLPNGNVFVAANLLSMVFDPIRNIEHRLPGLPNGVRANYPASAASVLLPLTVANDYTPEVLICGGTNANTEGNPKLLSSTTPASSQCIRMVINAAGIRKGWVLDELPDGPRVMGNAVLLADGTVRPAWLVVLADGVPSKSVRVMIGNGSGPPVSEYAINNMLANTGTSI